jgi:hypothetical protein
MSPVRRLMRRSTYTAEGCLQWAGHRNASGYAKVYVSDTKRPDWIHRVAYSELVGPIPEGLEIDHLCRNRACWRPDHLEAVTRAENVRRKARRQVCKRGLHALTPDNCYARNECKACAADRRLRNRAS